jgi:voltage-gated potassium channel
LIERRMTRFLREPPTVGKAAGVIVTSTVLIVVISAVAMRIFDHHEFPTFGVAIWWATQTVTTVGYGDTPVHKAIGRILGVIVMLEGVAFLAVVTAAITSTFVTRAERELGADQSEKLLREMSVRLERIEAVLARDHPDRTMPPSEPGA